MENFSVKEFHKNSKLIVQTLINNLAIKLELDSYQKDIRVIINKREISESNDIFSIGVNRYTQDKVWVVEVNEKYLKIFPFILFREIYSLFAPPEIRNYELVQIVINQIIMNDLSKSAYVNEWRALIRENLEQHDLLSGGFNRLTAFDRLESYFRFQESLHDPTRFFFHYIRRNSSIISDKIENIESDIHSIFFFEYETYLSELLNKDEIVETIRCLKEIFYKIEKYKDLESYKKYFQEFKETNKLQTKLSLRKFTKNFEWIKRYSYLAPSYQFNWNAINICVLITYFSFNPLLKKSKIFKLIENLPFFISPQISRKSFSIEFLGYFFLPKIYLQNLISFFRKLKNSGYIMRYHFFIRNSLDFTLNLNYLREYSQKYCIIDLNHQYYENRYEIEFKMNYGTKFNETKLNLLEFLLIDRIRFFNVSGLGFEKRSNTLKAIKSDLLNEIITERTIIKNLKNSLSKFHISVELKTEILRFIEYNEKFGFFYIKNMLDEILSLNSFFKEILINNPEVKNIHQFRDILKKKYYSDSIEKNIVLNNPQLKDIFFNKIISIYFKSKQEYIKNLENFKNFYELFNSCYNLKLFNLKAIRNLILDPNLLNTIYKIKEEKLIKSYEKWKLYKITNQEIDTIIDKFLNHEPPLIKPLLINTITIGKYAKENLQLILLESQETQKFIEVIKKLFPLTNVSYVRDLLLYENLIIMEFNIPNLTIKEKAQLFSIFHNNFKDIIQYGKLFLKSGYYPAISSKNFFDFTNKKFFYTKDLFKQYFLYIQKLLGEPLQSFQEKSASHEKFWSREKSISNLIKKVNDRILREHNDFTIGHLDKLVELHINLKNILLDTQKFVEIKKAFFFKNYIKSIKFLPAFQYFRLGQYFLYLYPTDMNELDFKLLFTNTFQKIKYPACIDNSNSLFIKYIIPHGAPQLKYLHWLTRSKKVIREYCGFFIKKVYQILHFRYNLSSEGWVYNKDSFKMHMQNILFKTGYNIQIPEMKEYKITDNFISSYLRPDSSEFESLSQIYNWKSIDIKSFLQTKKAKTVNHIINLLEKGLIFPYLSLKNLDLHDKVYVIIPNLKPELNDTLIKIFNFFNFAFVYETEGEYFIYGFEKEKKYQNGLMIKIYFPKCEISEFLRLFDLLFEYLEIKDYLILNDLVDGKNLIKSIYGGLTFLNSYNPLNNLEWNEQDKIWQNPKIFTSKFKPIYPDLISKDK